MSNWNNTNPVGWFEVYVNDLPRAQKFYENVFQMKLQDLPTPGDDAGAMEMKMFPEGSMTTYGANGALVKMEGFAAGKNSVLVYFSCDDCATEEKRIKEFGGSVLKEKMSIGEYGFITLFNDTEGNMLGLHSQK